MTTTDTPPEAPCDGCKQQRPLFLYRPEHDMHLVPTRCDWCERKQQPLLCVRCWGKERQREDEAPLAPGEAEAVEFFGRIAETNSRILAHRAANLEACEGIAAATEAAP